PRRRSPAQLGEATVLRLQSRALPQFASLRGGASTLRTSVATICSSVTNPNRVAPSRMVGICRASPYPGFRR
ncbi:MAG: hypothetical protein WA715_26605, partial [Candidatus Acidiferrum sp.]